MLNFDPVDIIVGVTDCIKPITSGWKTAFATGYVLARTAGLNGIVTWKGKYVICKQNQKSARKISSFNIFNTYYLDTIWKSIVSNKFDNSVEGI